MAAMSKTRPAHDGASRMRPGPMRLRRIWAWNRTPGINPLLSASQPARFTGIRCRSSKGRTLPMKTTLSWKAPRRAWAFPASDQAATCWKGT